MIPIGVRNAAIELRVLDNSYSDPEFMSLVLLERNLPKFWAKMARIH